LAKNLNFKVVAEGVENINQVEFLWKRNCDYIQGYYYSKPTTPGNLFSLITKEL
jgi:EAL domain-containing protein (putative c-di-GMP-specific phosphodiesterase class I)